jgi:hypothetical protein
VLIPEGKAADSVDERAIVSEVRKAYYTQKHAQQPTEDRIQTAPDTGDDLGEDEPAEDVKEELHWKQQVLNVVLTMSPDAFERLSQCRVVGIVSKPVRKPVDRLTLLQSISWVSR